jgi:hypothetical protein
LLPAGAAVARTGWRRAAIPALVKPALVVVAAFVPAFLAGNPYLARYGLRGAVPTDLTGALDLSVGGQGLAFRFDAKYTKEALAGLVGLEGVVLLLGVAGAVLLTRRRDRAAYVPFALAVPVFVFFSFYTGTHARYFLLAFPALWILGGVALATLAGRGAWGRAAAVVLAAIPVVLTVRGCVLLGREDTRNLALAAVPKAIPDGAVVAVEPYGPPFTASRASLERLAAAEAANPGVKVLTRRERLALDRAGEGGYDLLPLERVVHDPAPGGYTRLGGLAPVLYPDAQTLDGVLRAASVRFLVRVDRFPGAHRADPLLEILLTRGRLLSEVSPSDGRSYPLEALLPFEPRRGASSLFAVSRPGPLVRYYELRP